MMGMAGEKGICQLFDLRAKKIYLLLMI